MTEYKELKKYGRTVASRILALRPDCGDGCIEVNGRRVKKRFYIVRLQKMREHTASVVSLLSEVHSLIEIVRRETGNGK